MKTHTKTNALRSHHAELDANSKPKIPDEWKNMADELDYQQLCDREQAYFLKAIRKI